jgi:hypothetical protein
MVDASKEAVSFVNPNFNREQKRVGNWRKESTG